MSLLKSKKLLVPSAILLLLGLALTPIYWIQYRPKLTLFDKDKRFHNFRHMDEVFPARLIKKSSKPFTFKEAPRELKIRYNLSQVPYLENQEDQDRSLEDFFKRTRATGMVVLKDGTLVYERYLNGNSRESRNTSWSVAKSFVSALIGIAIAEGKIKSIDDPVTQYVPMLKDSGYNEVPIKHILQMSSGIQFTEIYNDKNSDINTMFWDLFLLRKPVEEYTASLVSVRPSGKTFDYTSIDTQVLGILLQRATGKTVSDYLHEKIWEPLGMESDAYWNTDEHGVELSFCMLNASLRDYAKFGLLYMNEGRWGETQIVPRDWVKESVVPDSPHLQMGKTGSGWGYQYQWWVPLGSTEDFSACGIWGQYIYVHPKERVVIVKTSCDPDHSAHKNENAVVFRAIVEALK